MLPCHHFKTMSKPCFVHAHHSKLTKSSWFPCLDCSTSLYIHNNPPAIYLLSISMLVSSCKKNTKQLQYYKNVNSLQCNMAHGSSKSCDTYLNTSMAETILTLQTCKSCIQQYIQLNLFLSNPKKIRTILQGNSFHFSRRKTFLTKTLFFLMGLSLRNMIFNGEK